MKVSLDEYKSLLDKLLDPNELTYWFRIPEDEPIYEINLNERKVYAPAFLSVEEDHNSEVIWFEADRFYDTIDLSSSTCFIKYKNAAKREFFYRAPTIPITNENGEHKIRIPWAISSDVAEKTGTIEFSFQFFKFAEPQVGYDFQSEFWYILNTQPAHSKILATTHIDPLAFLTDDTVNEDAVIPERTQLYKQLMELHDKYTTLEKDYVLNWIELPE